MDRNGFRVMRLFLSVVISRASATRPCVRRRTLSPRAPSGMGWKTGASASGAGGMRFVTAAVLAILLTGCVATMGGGDAGCASYAEPFSCPE